MGKQTVYFPNLNGLRFIAALLVIIHHIEQLKSIFSIDNYLGTVPFIHIIGKLGVILFFVLSGFLITYLLLTEEEKTKTIGVRDFYIRRILRIWPLYYLIVLLALCIIPNLSMFTYPGLEKAIVYKDLHIKVSLYIFFLSNLAFAWFGDIPYLAHTWSIGTEEQFYLLWPVILKYFKKHRILLMASVVVVYLLIFKVISFSYFDTVRGKYHIKEFWSSFNIDCMAIGGFYALLLFQKSKFLKFFMNKYLFYFVLLLTLILMIKGVYIPYIHYEVYATLFGIIILNFAANADIAISLENKVFRYLGKISYGLYMYQTICIALAIVLCKAIGIVSNWLLYPMSLFLIILTAGLSYRYYESAFLKLKTRFSSILSGDS